MRSSDREIVQYLDELVKLGNEIILSSKKKQKQDLLKSFIKSVKSLMEWPHHRQLNPLITMRIKNIELESFIEYINDLPVKERTYFFFKKVSVEPEKKIDKEIEKINLTLEAIKYFYKNK